MVQIPGTLAGFGGTICAPIAHDIYEDDFAERKLRHAEKSGGGKLK